MILYYSVVMLIDFFQKIVFHLASQEELILIFNILLSTALGLLIGHERHERGKSAGRSTFTFVIMGAMLFSYIS